MFSLVFAMVSFASNGFAQSSYSRKVEAKSSSTVITAKAGSTFAEKKLHRQLHRVFKRYAEALGTEVFGQEEFLRMAGRAETNSMLRKTLLDDYLMVLQDEAVEKLADADSATVRLTIKTVEDDFNRTKRTPGGELRLLKQYVELESQNFNRDVDALYRDMILELESKGHFEFARLFMDLMAKAEETNPQESFTELMSIAKENIAHLELDQRIQNAGGIEVFQNEQKNERQEQINWKCVNAKIAVSAALVPLTATTMFLGYHAAPIVAGYVTLKTAGSLIGSYGMLRLTSTAVKKVIRGCYREKHTRESIDGLIKQTETNSTEKPKTE